MRGVAGLSFFCWSVLLVPQVALAAVVINEILFDPAGTDTGLEKIELYNPDALAADMSAWEIYPDGIGYFSFPAGFSLAPKSFAVVHLRTSGTNDTANLYHAGATSNMGNSSGSVALFKPGGRSKDTIADFIRYHKPGSSERKTWESAAAEAGLWTAGTSVDTSSLGEGASVGLTADGVRGSAAAWQIYALPSLGSANAPAAAGAPVPATTPPAATATPPAPPPPEATAGTAAPPPVPSLGADAGPDATALAGASVMFSGMALGLDGKPLPEARFLWNFGDGALGEGRTQRHVYRFPGVYHANLSVQSGHYAGADWRMVTVALPELSVSEVKPGSMGFVEIANASAEAIDLGGLSLGDGRISFTIPAGTRIARQGVLAFANATTGLDPVATVTLRDARPTTLDAAEFPGVLPAGASWEKSGGEYIIQRSPTPGRWSLAAAVAPAPVPMAPSSLPPLAAPEDAPPGARTVPAAVKPPPAVAGIGATIGPGVFLAASALLGLAMAAAIVALKRAAPPSGST